MRPLPIIGGLWRGGRGGSFLLSILLAAGLFGFGAATISGFAARYSVTSTLTLSALLGIAAAGQTLVIVLGGIDLSIPFVIGLADVVAGELNGRGWPFGATLALVLVLAACIGAVNGFLASRLRVHPLIITLGMGFAVHGGVLYWNGGLPTGTTPGWLTQFVSSGSVTGPIPLPPVVVGWLAFGMTIIGIMRHTRFGRMLYALGSNERAAELALVRRTAMWTAIFALSSVCAAVAGVLLLGFTGSVYADVGAPYLFLSVGAVVVGGTSLLGGVGGYGRTVIGALIITELTTVLVGLGLGQALLETVLGVVIVVVVALYGREAPIRTRI